MGRMIVTNALIITMTDRKTITGYVRVGAGAITEIGVGSPPEIKSDEQVVDALVPVLAERGAAHADDGDLVLDAVRAHRASPSSSRASAITGLPFQK